MYSCSYLEVVWVEELFSPGTKRSIGKQTIITAAQTVRQHPNVSLTQLSGCGSPCTLCSLCMRLLTNCGYCCNN